VSASRSSRSPTTRTPPPATVAACTWLRATWAPSPSPWPSTKRHRAGPRTADRLSRSVGHQVPGYRRTRRGDTGGRTCYRHRSLRLRGV
jgi:hypothetical protein